MSKEFFLLKLMAYVSKSTVMKFEKQPMGLHIHCKMLMAKGSSISGNYHHLSTH